MIDNIGLNNQNPAPVDLSQLYQSAELPVNAPATRSVRQSELSTSAEIVIDGDHSFQAHNAEDSELNVGEMETPEQPLPLQDAKEEHDAGNDDDWMDLGVNRQQDQKVLMKMAKDLGEKGKVLIGTLIQTPAFKARMDADPAPLSEEEIQKLENTTSELCHELETGVLTPEELLTRTNAKVFELTSLNDMTELVTKTNNQINEITGRTGFEELYEQALDNLEKQTQLALNSLIQALKTGSDVGENMNAVLEDLSLFPAPGQDEFDESAFMIMLAGNNNGNIVRNNPRIVAAARMLYNLRSRRVDLESAFNELKQVRRELLQLDSQEKPLNITLNPALDPQKQAKAVNKTATANSKRLEHISSHPDKKLNETHRQALDNFFTKFDASQRLLPLESYHNLPGDPETAMRQFNDSLKYHAKTLHDTCQQLQFALFQPARAKLIQKQIAAITPLWENGGSQSISGNIGLGIPGEAMGVPIAGNLTLSYNYTLDCTNQKGPITAANVKGVTVGLKVGNKKVCSVTVSASKLFTNAKIFANPQDFVEHNTNSMLSAILLKRSFLFQSIHNRRFDRNKWIAMTNNNLMLNRLNMLGAIDTGDSLSTGNLKSTKPIYTEMKTRTKMLKSDLKALDGIISNVSSASKAKSKMTINSDIFDTLQKDPRLYGKQKASYFINRAAPKESGGSPLEIMARQERLTQKALENRDLRKLERYNQIFYLALEDLHTEFKTYTNVVNAYEMESLHTPAFVRKLRHLLDVNDTSSLKGKLLEVKLNFDKARGASNRGEYLRAIMFTHARLTELYNKSTEGIKQLTKENIPITLGVTNARLDRQQQAIADFKDDYINPPMRMNHKRHVQKFMTIKKNSEIITTSQDSTSNFIIPAKLQAGLELKATRKNVKKHHMRCQQVETSTVEFSVNSGNIKKFSSIMAAVAGHCHDGTLPTALVKATISDLVNNFKTGSSLPEGVVLSKNAAFRVQLNFIRGKDEKLRFNNCALMSHGGANASVTASVVNVGGGMNQTNILGQFIGHKSLNYPFNRFFFTRQPDGSSPANWYNFLDTNIKNVRKLFYNAIIPGNNAYEELASYNDDGEVPDCQKDLNEFINKMKAPEDAKEYQKDSQHPEFKYMNDEELKTAFTELMHLMAKFEGQVTAKRLDAQN